MERLRQAFQKPTSSDHSCPNPELVIGCALGELGTVEQQQVQAHLQSCRDCLDLFLDVRLARAEAETPADEGLEGETPHKAGWLEVLGRKVRETLPALLKPRKLIPALATVSLVALVFILGREERSKVLPPTRLASKYEAAPTPAPSAAPPRAPEGIKPPPAVLGLSTAKKKADSAAPALEKSIPIGAVSESRPFRLDLTEAPTPGGGDLSYRADRDVFAYLLRQDSSGRISLLFSGKLEGGKTYSYPIKDHLLQSDATAVQTTILLVASEKPVSDLETKLQTLERRSTKQVHDIFPGAVIRSLTVKLP
jgi:hypothetical protein